MTRQLDLLRIARTLLCSAAVALAACGGGGGDAPPPTIGAAGGTASGPNGAQVVVPAGALAANTSISVAQAGAGSLALPATLTSVGAVYAFTPHGQSFATPVTLTVPVDPALVPAGATVKLFKTANGAAGPWEEVAGATVSGNLISGQVTGFSLAGAVVLVGNTPPSITQQPVARSVAAPASASFSTTFVGTPGFQAQWQRSNDGGTNWVGAGAVQTLTTSPATSTYTTGATSTAAAGAGGDNGAQFRALISNVETIAPVISAAVALTVTAAPAGSLTGTWISNYQCAGSGGNFAGQDTLIVTQTGANVSFTASDGGSFTGTLSGSTMTYSGGAPGAYTETGTWTIRADGNSFTKTSNYLNAGGTGGSCPGAGQRDGVPFTLLVIVTGNGSVSDGPGGINLCAPASGDCTQAYPSGTQVTLSATENAPGVVFNGWGAACFDVPSPFAARVVMDSSKTCTASFSP